MTSKTIAPLEAVACEKGDKATKIKKTFPLRGRWHMGGRHA